MIQGTMVTQELKPRSSEEAQTELNFISLSQTGQIRGPGLRDSRIVFCKSESDFSRKSSDSSSISVAHIQGFGHILKVGCGYKLKVGCRQLTHSLSRFFGDVCLYC
ncbi:hypothetical protein L1887_09319 [Cichorium endivia]|nr:hypothetical protein L1887_09319 [Cichorium endivia]